jgi:hypothetical protein
VIGTGVIARNNRPAAFISKIGSLVSLRDICANVNLAAQNIVDDVDHCLQAKLRST